MKTKSKALLFSLSAVLLMSASVLGTMAYFTSADEVVNTFTVGAVSIELDEAAVKEDGTYLTDHDNRVDANVYHLLPGHTYSKDPTVTVKKGSADSHVRTIVTITVGDAFAEQFPNGMVLDDKIVGNLSEDWDIQENASQEGNEYIYEFRYGEIVAAPDSDVVLDDLFESFTVPGNLTNDQIAALNGLEIKVVAHAIQAGGFSDAAAAWSAFEAE